MVGVDTFYRREGKIPVNGEKLKNILTSTTFGKFVIYVPLAGIATLVDWGSFYLLYNIMMLHYALAVIISYTLGGLANYTLNKFFNFRDRVKTIGFQMAVYGVIMGIAYGLNILLMFIQIDLMHIPGFVARVMTTGIVLVYNFLMHKSFTFNKKIQDRIAAFFK